MLWILEVRFRLDRARGGALAYSVVNKNSSDTGADSGGGGGGRSARERGMGEVGLVVVAGMREVVWGFGVFVCSEIISGLHFTYTISV